MSPTFYPKGKVSNMSSNSKPLRQLWHKSGRCPEGTIPIRRTKIDDILRAKSIKNFGKKEQGRFPQPNSSQPPPNSFFNWNLPHEVMIMHQKQCLVTTLDKNNVGLGCSTSNNVGFYVGCGLGWPAGLGSF